MPGLEGVRGQLLNGPFDARSGEPVGTVAEHGGIAQVHRAAGHAVELTADLPIDRLLLLLHFGRLESRLRDDLAEYPQTLLHSRPQDLEREAEIVRRIRQPDPTSESLDLIRDLLGGQVPGPFQTSL